MAHSPQAAIGHGKGVVALLGPPLALIYSPVEETLNPEPFSPEAIPISAVIANKLRGAKIPALAPCRNVEVPPDSSPLMLLPPHDDARVVPPRG